MITKNKQKKQKNYQRTAPKCKKNDFEIPKRTVKNSSNPTKKQFQTQKNNKKQLQIRRKNYQRTAPNSAKKITKEQLPIQRKNYKKLNPAKKITREQLQARRRKLPQNNTKPGEENNSKPGEGSYHRTIQTWQINIGRKLNQNRFLVENYQEQLQTQKRKLSENSSKTPKNLPELAPNRQKKLLQIRRRNYKRILTRRKKLPENNSKPGEENYRRTTPNPAKKLPENNSKPGKGSYHRTTPNPANKLIGMKLNQSRFLIENYQEQLQTQ